MKIDLRQIESELHYSTSRSSGSGGQHVNKVETKVTLRFNVKQSATLSEDQKKRILKKLKNKINKSGELVLHQETDRSQLKNKEKVKKRFFSLLKSALKAKKKRKPTTVPESVKVKRLKAKRHRSEIKENRKKIDPL